MEIDGLKGAWRPLKLYAELCGYSEISGGRGRSYNFPRPQKESAKLGASGHRSFILWL